MHLTRGGEYGLWGVLYLAHQADGKVNRVSAIAEAQGIPPRFLAKLFQMLAKAGVLKSHRGIRGGFSLARSAADITIRDIIEAIEGPICLCRDDTEPARSVWKRVQEALIGVLSRNTLADLVRADVRRATMVERTSVGLSTAQDAPMREPSSALGSDSTRGGTRAVSTRWTSTPPRDSLAGR